MNKELLDKYALCANGEEVVKVQNEYLAKCVEERGQQGQEDFLVNSNHKLKADCEEDDSGSFSENESSESKSETCSGTETDTD